MDFFLKNRLKVNFFWNIISFSLYINLVYSGNYTANTFSIAWLSDTHVGSNTGEEDLRKAIATIQQMPLIKQVIVSGDISQMDIKDNLLCAKKILDELSIPYAIIPGNHDLKWSASGGQKFIDLWGDDKFSLNFAGIQWIGLAQGPVMRMGPGCFNPRDIDWLRTTLEPLRKSQIPIFFVTHYPMDSSVCNYRPVLDLLKECNVQFILHGHEHRLEITNYDGITAIMAPANIRDDSPKGQFMVIKIIPDSLLLFEHPHGNTVGVCRARLARRSPTGNTPDLAPHDQDIRFDPELTNIIWRHDYHDLLLSPPAVDKTTLYCALYSGRVEARSLEKGQLLWHYSLDETITASPTLYDSLLIIGTDRHHLFIFNNQTGRLLRKINLPGPLLATPLIEYSIAYCPISEQGVLAWDIKNNRQLWFADDIRGYCETQPIIYRDLILCGAWDENFYAFAKSTGEKVWTWHDHRPGLLYSPGACQPVITQDILFLVTPDRFLSAIQPKTGKTLWRSNQLKVRESLGYCPMTSTIYVKCMTDTLAAIEPSADSLIIHWISDQKFGYDINPASPVANGHLVFIPTQKGELLILDQQNGKRVTQIKLGQCQLNLPVFCSDNRVILSAMDGKLAVIRYKANLNERILNEN